MRKQKRDKISGLPEKEKPLGFFSGIAVLANKTIYRRTSGASRGRALPIGITQISAKGYGSIC